MAEKEHRIRRKESLEEHISNLGREPTKETQKKWQEELELEVNQMQF